MTSNLKQERNGQTSAQATPRMTRRALLAGIAASSTVALPAVAIATPAVASELPDMVERFLDVRYRACDATTAREKCLFAVRETYPKRPRALMGKRTDYSGKPDFYRLRASDINEWYDTQAEIFGIEGARRAAHEKKRSALLRRLEKWEAREQTILDASNWPALKAAEDALDAEADDLEAKIIAYKARTIADVSAKVRFLGYWAFDGVMDGDKHREDLDANDKVFISLWADTERLAGKS